MAQARRRVGAARTAVAEAEPGETELTPIYAAALLKVALELRRPGRPRLEELCRRVLEGLPVDLGAFQAYLARNFSLVQSSAAKGRRRLGTG
ncbi:MAG: hypothetical protein ACYCWW_02960 [Deltaproteobacteria bacterium]